MNRLLAVSVTVCMCALTICRAQDKPSPANALPVRRVVLFKNGVGYFEHVGNVHGNGSVAVLFTSGQLNDVLKSLTVLDLNGGRITGVAYGTSTPLNRQMQDACGALGGKDSMADMLRGLKGSRVEVRNGPAVASGRVLSVEQKSRISGTVAQQVDYLALVSEGGEFRTVELVPATSVRLLDAGLASQLDQCLNVANAERAADVRKMVISTEGSGDRSLSVSYVSEVPVWKSTYRLVLDSKRNGHSFLQGWAIVDNVLGEDWNNVDLSLVAGAPQSFVQNLSQPYFAKRPTVAMPDTYSTSPQTYQSTLLSGTSPLSGVVKDPSGAAVPGATVKLLKEDDSLVAQVTTDATGTYEFPNIAEGTYQVDVTAPGFQTAKIAGLSASSVQPITLQVGNATQSVEVTATAPSAMAGVIAGNGTRMGGGREMGAASKRWFGAGAGGGSGGGTYRVSGQGGFDVAALNQALGDLFEYKLKSPITILKNRSALVPIVQADVSAEKVSIWNESDRLPRPQRAVWITNDSGLTLDGGSFSVLEDNTFTGEGIFDPIQPGEKRLLSYATDLAVIASSKQGTEEQRVSRVVVADGMLRQERELQEKKTYTFRNQDAAPRTIVVEHPVRAGYRLKSQTRPTETTADWMRFKVAVAPKETASLVVEEALPIESSFALTNITPDEVELFVKQGSVDSAIRVSLMEILAQKQSIAALGAQSNTLSKEMQGIFDDQQRLRENVKALKGTPEEKPLLQRYTRQLDDQETRLGSLQKQIAEVTGQLDAANAKLNDMIRKLAFDVVLP